jgi:hypothetical protein
MFRMIFRINNYYFLNYTAEICNGEVLCFLRVTDKLRFTWLFFLGSSFYLTNAEMVPEF